MTDVFLARQGGEFSLELKFQAVRHSGKGLRSASKANTEQTSHKFNTVSSHRHKAPYIFISTLLLESTSNGKKRNSSC